MTKCEMRDLLDDVADGNGAGMTLAQFLPRKDEVLDAAQKMMNFYRTSSDVHSDIKEYYEQDFARIEGASSDNELLVAVRGLAISIFWQ